MSTGTTAGTDQPRPRLPVIDTDCHVVEPFDLWAEELPERFRPFARQRQLDADGAETLFHHGRELDLEWTVGALCTPGSRPSTRSRTFR